MATSYLSRFSIPSVEKCCCLQLKTGGIIIACVFLIPVTLAAGVAGWEMITTSISRGQVRSDDEFANLTEEFEMIESWHDAYIAQFAMVESATLVVLASCILHIYGAVKEKRVLMIPFMTIAGFVTNVTICSEIVRILFWTTSVLGFFIAVGLGAVGVYSMLILLSYYRQLAQKPPSTKEDDVIEAIEGAL